MVGKMPAYRFIVRFRLLFSIVDGDLVICVIKAIQPVYLLFCERRAVFLLKMGVGLYSFPVVPAPSYRGAVRSGFYKTHLVSRQEFQDISFLEAALFRTPASETTVLRVPVPVKGRAISVSLSFRGISQSYSVTSNTVASSRRGGSSAMLSNSSKVISNHCLSPRRDY